jgi:ABC-type uncharacterized transport system auxiliary subunit
MRSAVQWCLIATLCALVSACFSSKAIRYYRIEVMPTAQPDVAAASSVTLAVATIDCPPIMRDGRILYQIKEHEVGAYEYHRWVETPDRMIQNSLVRLLRSSGRYRSVDTQRSGVNADFIVGGRIYEFSEVDRPEIHARVSLEIELRDAKTRRIVWSRTYTREDPVQGKEVTNVVASLDQNLRQGLMEIVTGLHQYLGAR